MRSRDRSGSGGTAGAGRAAAPRGRGLRAWLAGTALLAAGCGFPAPQEEEVPASPAAEDAPAAVARAETFYRQACRSCHGALGDGQGPRAERFDPAPTDLTRGIYQCRSTASGVLPLDRDLYDTITLGVPGTSMPAYAELFCAQARMDLVQYIKRFSPRFAKEAIDPKDVLEIPAAPVAALVASVESDARGAAAYRKRCARCHGDEGAGDGPAAEEVDEAGRRTRATDLRRGTFRWGAQGRDIYRSVFTGLDGTPMRSFADSIPEEDRWSLVRFVQSLRRPPSVLGRILAGSAE